MTNRIKCKPRNHQTKDQDGETNFYNIVERLSEYRGGQGEKNGEITKGKKK